MLSEMETRLSQEVDTGLKRAGNTTLVNEDVFANLVDSALTAITQSDSSTGNVASLFSRTSKGDILKEAHCSLLTLLVEVARREFPVETLQTLLETKMNWPKSRAKKLCDVYSCNLPQIQASLSNVGFNPPHIVDVQWSLNHNIKSSSSEHNSSSIVSLQLETEGPSEGSSSRHVKFVCSVPQLQDLVSKLKEALRQIEHVAQINHV